MITELMMLLIAVGVGIIFVAWTNTRRRKQDFQERREVEESTGKLKQELERTATEIIGRMENHVTHLENVLDESERNRTQLEGRVNELKKLLKKGEGQSGEIRDLLAKLDDAGAEVDSMQRKMDVIERKLNLAMSTPLPYQQPVAMPQMTPQMPAQMVPPIISPPRTPAPIASISTPTPVTPINPTPVQPIAKPVTPINAPPVTKITSPPAQPLNPLGPITAPPTVRQTSPEPKIESPKVEVAPVAEKAFDTILEESIATPPKVEEPARPPIRNSVILSPETKQPMTVVEADPVKIEATRKRLNEVSAEMAKNPPKESIPVERQPQTSRKKKKSTRLGRDVRKAALEAIREAERQSAVEVKPVEVKPVEEPKEIILPPVKPKPPEKIEILPERRELKLETTDSAIVKEMLLAGMSIEDISRGTGLGRGAIELIQEMTRRQLDRR